MADYSLLGRGFSVADSLSALGMGQQQRLQNQKIQRDQQLRTASMQAYDPNTGQYDPKALTNAYASVGDVQGAFGVQDQQRQNAAAQQAAKAAQFKDVTAKLELTTQLLGGVTDQASYDAARQRAQILGLDVSNIPPQYNPAMVNQMRMQAISVKDQLAAEQAKWLVVPDGGTVVDVRNPNAVSSVNSQTSQAPVQVTSPDQIRSLAPGTEFIAPDGSVRRVPGGAPSQGGATFP